MKIEIAPDVLAYMHFADPPKGALFLIGAPHGAVEVKVIDSVTGTITAWIWVNREELKKAMELL